jgi:WS/DGAT/MGAT family acyltransferase
LRGYLLHHDCLPEESLIAMVPVSVRSGDEADTYQNRVSALLAELATNERDPVKRLKRIQQSMSVAKGNLAAIPAEALMDFTQFAPPAVAARAMRMASRMKIADRMNPPFNIVISNVPGPNAPLYMAGAELQHFYPVSTIADGQGLNMTVQSYNGNLDFGFVACRELVPDVWMLTDLLQDSMNELLVAANKAVAQPAAKAASKAAKPKRKAATKSTTKAAGKSTTKAAARKAS